MIEQNSKVPRRISQTVLNSLKGGVVPRIGLPYITVGRKNEIEALIKQDPEVLKDWDKEVGDRMIKLVFIGKDMDNSIVSSKMFLKYCNTSVEAKTSFIEDLIYIVSSAFSFSSINFGVIGKEVKSNIKKIRLIFG